MYLDIINEQWHCLDATVCDQSKCFQIKPFNGSWYGTILSTSLLCTKLIIGHNIDLHFTVSHFSYAPIFKGRDFFTKMLESNILYDNLLIDILSV